MTAPLFLVDGDRLSAAVAGDVVALDGAEGRHAARVRRLAVGERLELGDGAGLVWSGSVAEVVGDQLRVVLHGRTVTERTEPLIVVVQGLAKGDRDERAVEIMTEVGVDAIMAWSASRSIVRWDAGRAEKALIRWRAVAREAAKQSRRRWLPEVVGLASTSLVAGRIRDAIAGGGAGIVLHEGADQPLSALELPSRGEIVVVVGPEGGIPDDELAILTGTGARACRLGPSVLRTSSAGAVAAAVLSARTGRWG